MTEPRVTLHLLATSTVLHTGRRMGTEPRRVNLDRFEVRLDGTKVGTVERAMLTRERPRARGSRISNGRWQSPGWIVNGHYWQERSSRVAAVATVLDGVLTGLVDDGTGTGAMTMLYRLEAERAVVVK